MDDAGLVAAAQAGDRRALEDLLRAHHDRIHALCRRTTGNDTDALDATQEALIAIVRGIPRYDGRASFATWTYRIAVNACLDELRRRRRRPSPVDLDGRPPVAPTGDVALDTTVTDRITIDDAMGRLPVEFRAAVVLRDVCGLDYTEIGEVLGIPSGTVRSRIARGRAAIADRITGNQPTPEPRQNPSR